jgi:hypothetical protein
MQTHKNPSLRDNAPIVAPKPKAGSPPAAAKAAPQRPPRFELEGKKWAVEFQRNNQNLVKSVALMKVLDHCKVFVCASNANCIARQVSKFHYISLNI